MELHQPLNNHRRAGYGSTSETDQQAVVECAVAESDNAALHAEAELLRGDWTPRRRDRISRFLDQSFLGAALDVALMLLSVIFAAIYVANTYIPANNMPGSFWIAEIICAICFTVDFLFRDVYLSTHRTHYLLSLSGLTNLAVVLPVLPTSFFVSYHTLWYDASYWRFVYPLRFVKCYLEGKAVLSRCHAILSPVRQFALLCYLQLVLIVAGAAGIIQIAETSDGVYTASDLGQWTFFNAFFNSIMALVTISAPAADNALAKVFVGGLVAVLVLVVPYQVSHVFKLGSTFSQYERATYTPSPFFKHLVLCGDLTPSRIDHFFREVFHEDHDVVNIHVVVLSEDPPASSLIALLMDPFMNKRTKFIQGSLLDVDDAQRAACDSADAIFVLARRVGQETPASSDHRALMRVLAARRLAPKARVFAQLHLSANRGLIADLGVPNVLCFSEIMHSLLGQNCVCPGFSTFMYGLTSSASYKDTSRDIKSSTKKKTPSWEDQYLRGSAYEVYSVSLPPSAIVYGKTFSEVVSLAYSHCSGVLVFAITTASAGGLLLNPGDSYSCVGGETVFVIAEDQREASAVTDMGCADAMPHGWNMQGSLSLASNGSKTTKAATDSGDSTTRHHSATLKRKASRLVNWTLPVGMATTSMSKANPPPSSRGVSPNAEDAVVEDVQELEFSLDPIVICVLSATTFPRHLEYLLGPLRVHALQQHRPIVIVTATLPDVDDYRSFRRFHDVYFVVGDPFRSHTLERAGVAHAFRVVVMGNESDVSEASSSELLQDASCIALHKKIVRLMGAAEAPRVITELTNRANVHFVAQSLVSSGWFESKPQTPASTSSLELARNFFVSPAFASGLTYSTSLCDSLLISQFFNPRIKRIMQEFMFVSWPDEEIAGGSDEASSPSSSSSASSDHTVQRSSLFVVEVPRDFVGRCFEFVLHSLLSSDGILAIGLYRCRPDPRRIDDADQNTPARIEFPESERGVPFGYVYVNPGPLEELKGDDLLYVLSGKQPCWAADGGLP